MALRGYWGRERVISCHSVTKSYSQFVHEVTVCIALYILFLY